MANGAASGINATFQKNCITCLHVAAKNGLKEMVQLLIQNRCNPNIQAKGGVLAADEAKDEEVYLKGRSLLTDPEDDYSIPYNLEC